MVSILQLSFKISSNFLLNRCLISTDISKKILRNISNQFNGNKQNLLLTKPKNCLIPNRTACKHKHSHQEWNFEKFTTLLLVAVIPPTILYPSPIFDYILTGLLVYHHHVGFHSILIDYARPIVLGKGFAKMFHIGNYFCTALIAFGLILFIHKDIGIGNACRRFWVINHEKK